MNKHVVKNSITIKSRNNISIMKLPRLHGNRLK